MKLNKYIDHTILKQDATKEDVERICDEALKYDFASVCVNTYYTKLVAEKLKNSDVKTCVTVAFPLGAGDLDSKVYEAKTAVGNGAEEVDYVINVGALKDGMLDYIEEEMRQIKEAVGDKTLKVILETCLLTKDEIVEACVRAARVGVDFVKTSTGFSTGGATLEDVELMKKTVDGKCKVKASGGIRSKDDALKYIEIGADRIGTSSGIKIVE